MNDEQEQQVDPLEAALIEAAWQRWYTGGAGDAWRTDMDRRTANLEHRMSALGVHTRELWELTSQLGESVVLALKALNRDIKALETRMTAAEGYRSPREPSQLLAEAFQERYAAPTPEKDASEVDADDLLEELAEVPTRDLLQELLWRMTHVNLYEDHAEASRLILACRSALRNLPLTEEEA